MLGKGWLLAGLSLLSSLSFAKVQITSLSPCDQQGSAVQPQLGDEFYLRAELSSNLLTSDTASLYFTAPSGNRWTPKESVNGNLSLVWGPFRCLADMPMNIDVKVVETGAVQHLTVMPVEPISAVEKYAPQAVSASFWASWSGQLGTGKWVIPVPSDGPFQQMDAVEVPGFATPAAVGGQQVAVWTGGTTASVNTSYTGFSARVNSGLLRHISFAQLDSGSPQMQAWLGSESYLPVANATFGSLVSSSLGSNYRATKTPFEAAQALYQLTIKKLAYTATAYAPDAVAALKRGKGDCASFASVFVTLCRRAGIPARPALGFIEGTNKWHVWAEFWLPNVGWIPVDPAYADGLRPAGDVPLYFGVIPDLNKRLVTSYGYDRVVDGTTIKQLQSPALLGVDPRNGTWTSGCTLSAAN